MSNSIIPPSRVTWANDPARRLRFRLWQVAMTLATLFLCGWFFTLGVFPGVAFAFLAKHILVAVFVAGMRFPHPAVRDEPRVEDAEDREAES